MPSILTLEGPPRRKRRRKSRAERGLGDPRVGECKTVHNPRTKRSIQLCFVGKSRSAPTGWRFKRNT